MSFDLKQIPAYTIEEPFNRLSEAFDDVSRRDIIEKLEKFNNFKIKKTREEDPPIIEYNSETNIMTLSDDLVPETDFTLKNVFKQFFKISQPLKYVLQDNSISSTERSSLYSEMLEVVLKLYQESAKIIMKNENKKEYKLLTTAYGFLMSCYFDQREVGDKTNPNEIEKIAFEITCGTMRLNQTKIKNKLFDEILASYVVENKKQVIK